MGGPWGHYAKWDVLEKDKYYMILLTYETLKKTTLTHRNRDQVEITLLSKYS